MQASIGNGILTIQLHRLNANYEVLSKVATIQQIFNG
jgi:hypothetical protein